MGVCICGFPVNSACVCLCVCTASLWVHMWEKPFDSSDRKAQVTVWYEQKYTDHFWWDYLLFLFVTAFR